MPLDHFGTVVDRHRRHRVRGVVTDIVVFVVLVVASVIAFTFAARQSGRSVAGGNSAIGGRRRPNRVRAAGRLRPGRTRAVGRRRPDRVAFAGALIVFVLLVAGVIVLNSPAHRTYFFMLVASCC